MSCGAKQINSIHDKPKFPLQSPEKGVGTLQENNLYQKAEGNICNDEKHL